MSPFLLPRWPLLARPSLPTGPNKIRCPWCTGGKKTCVLQNESPGGLRQAATSAPRCFTLSALPHATTAATHHHHHHYHESLTRTPLACLASFTCAAWGYSVLSDGSCVAGCWLLWCWEKRCVCYRVFPCWSSLDFSLAIVGLSFSVCLLPAFYLPCVCPA